MKALLVSLLMVTSVQAYAGYTAEVCQYTEQGIKTSCKMVYFKHDLGQPSSYVTTPNCHSENSSDVCENPNAHVPKWLKDMNQWFLDHGFTPAPEQPEHNN